MTRARAILGAALAAAMLAGCASHEARVADAATRAVYANDVDGLTAQFAPSLRGQVTRAQLGALSDLLHRQGDYRSLVETGTEPDGAYDFRADFAKGSVIVKMKLDETGRIAGYRIIPANAQ